MKKLILTVLTCLSTFTFAVDKKVTDLPAITGSAVNTANDVIMLVHPADGVNGSKKISIDEFYNSVPALALPLSKLGQSGATSGQAVVWNGSAWAAATIVSNLTSGPVTSSAGVSVIANGAITNAMLANSAVANLTGTNSGDNAINSLYSGLAASKQDTLISGTNIVTVNGNPLNTSGNLTITAGLDGTVASLRSGNIAGSDNLATINSKLSKPFIRQIRKGAGGAGEAATNQGTVVNLGDSVTVDIGNLVQNQLGYGGLNAHVGQASPTVTGTFTSEADQWHRSTHGYARSMTSSDSLIVDAPGIMTDVAVSYLASNGGGSFKVQYQTNKTGSYIDATNAWFIEKLPRIANTTSGSP